jgi:hypothetical protein
MKRLSKSTKFGASNPHLTLWLVAALVVGANLSAQTTPNIFPAGEVQEIPGIAVAYQPVLRLAVTTNTENSDSLIFRDLAAGQKTPRFLKVEYKRWSVESPLPAAMVNGTTQWRLKLVRDESCDEMITDVLPKGPVPQGSPDYQLTGANGRDDFPLGKQLPCYVMKPGGFTQITDTFTEQIEFEDATVCQLMADPASFAAKTIRLRAIYRYMFEIQRLQSPACCPGHGLKTWVEIGDLDSRSEQMYRSFPEAGLVLGTFIGRFETGGPYGDGGYGFRFTVIRIEDVEATSRASAKHLPKWLPRGCGENSDAQ